MASEGRVLSRWGDAGWGTSVARAKKRELFGDDLVGAMADMIRRWQPDPSPEWVTCIPSARRPMLVRSLAERVARRLHLPFSWVLDPARLAEPQKLQQNSFRQCRNLDGAFSVRGNVRRTPVLLVDDIVDSGWTFTIAAALLRKSGSGAVLPVALTSAALG